jgi:hypothetical protein
MIGFAPVESRPQPFRCFWSLDAAWGATALGAGWAELEVLGGALALNTLRLPAIQDGLAVQATLAGQAVEVEAGAGELAFSAGVTIPAGQTLVLRWEG